MFKLTVDLLLEVVQILLLLDLQLLDQLKGGAFVVAHILVPSVGELLELKFLSILDID